ncbi:12260_t:CDS:2 [Funneliformis mosseae]|uniref:12260_t:CDS:1 n=1 Tax=Funneliformis mosseae TaxID=27381 RepID=A0A9N8V524_FUNMO|nr:12260_t:CDS:2 [Funneliformis mosseae]
MVTIEDIKQELAKAHKEFNEAKAELKGIQEGRVEKAGERCLKVYSTGEIATGETNYSTTDR